MKSSAPDRNLKPRVHMSALLCAGLLILCLPTTILAQMRTAQGKPGPDYWQQQVDYRITATLNTDNHSLSATSVVTYHNNSPNALHRLWFQLEQNRFRPDSRAMTIPSSNNENTAPGDYLAARKPGIRQLTLKDGRGNDIPFLIQDTFVELALPQPLQQGERIELHFSWQLNLLDRTRVRARSGYELLGDGSPIYLGAQWYPRAAVYHDEGWQLSPFLGGGEFSLEFGTFQVTLEVPTSFVVAATGSLDNAQQVLSDTQYARWTNAKRGERELVASPGSKPGGKAAWRFSAERVRDFSFAASPAFYWEAQAVVQGETQVLTQVFYPAEGMRLWKRYGIDAIQHSLSHYGDWLFPYPYPTASIVNIAGLGMEYPMLGVVGERGTSEMARWDMIGGIIHEVGHNWFPMIVNSNERDYAWMDEGLVAFIEYHAEKAWDPEFVIIYGEPKGLDRYQGTPRQQPLMTKADGLTHRIDNAYDFSAAVLNILRSEVLGEDVFDKALKGYASDWQFKRARATDFFNAMEAYSERDLDDFWQTWFYGLGERRDDSSP